MLFLMTRKFIISLALASLVAACGPSSSERIAAANKPKATSSANTHTTSNPVWGPMAGIPQTSGKQVAMASTPVRPRIVTPRKRGQCVPYARQLSGIPIHGDAWTWWRQAAGKYRRSARPTVGSVLVFRRTSRNRYGHLAVVTRIINDREVIVNHQNWLNKGRIHIDTPVRDVSRRNDWSAVRVWYTPGNVLGRSTYAAHGFIHPSRQQAAR